MVLVEYSDSEDDDEQQCRDAPPLKKRRIDNGNANGSDTPLPVLPSEFRSLYATSVRTSTIDDPALHGGRVRQAAHVEGKWPTHVYVEWCPDNDQYEKLTQLIHNERQNLEVDGTEIHELLHSDLGTPLPLHISLSAPLLLRTEQKDDFRNSLINELARTDVASFSVTSSTIGWVANFDRTRYFLILRIPETKPSTLTKLLTSCNKAAAEFGQPLLYGNYSNGNATEERDALDDSSPFHISIAWALQAARATDIVGLNEMPSTAAAQFVVDFDTVKLKIGNTIDNIKFKGKQG